MSRNLFVVFLMCAVVCAQAALLSPGHLHQDSSQHCCWLCHAGPLPFLPSAAPAVVARRVAIAWLSAFSDLDAAHEVLLAAGSSRAPPA